VVVLQIVNILLLVNIVVVLIGNGLYVYVILTGSFWEQILASGVLIAFKLTWNTAFVIPNLDRLRAKFYIVLFFLVFNNVVAPVLATMAVDVSCFESLFHNPKPIVATYTLHECSLYTVTHCDTMIDVDTTISFSPPFLYSEQCSSAILSRYVPIFIGIYGVVGLSVYAIQLSVLLYFRHTKSPTHSPNSKSNSNPADPADPRTQLMLRIKKHIKYYSLFSNNILSDMVFPIESIADLVVVVNVAGDRSGDSGGVGPPPNPAPSTSTNSDPDPTPSGDVDVGLNIVEVKAAPVRDSLSGGGTMRLCKFGMYKSRGLALNSTVILTLLLTFGLAYPPLAVVLVLHIIASTLVLQLCIHHHRIQIGSLNRKRVDYLWSEILQAEMRDMHRIVFGSRTLMVLCSYVFICLFLFDMCIMTNRTVFYTLAVLLFGTVCLLMQGIKYARKHYDTPSDVWKVLVGLCAVCWKNEVDDGMECCIDSSSNRDMDSSSNGIELQTVYLPGTRSPLFPIDLDTDPNSDTSPNSTTADTEEEEDEDVIVVDRESQHHVNSMNPLLTIPELYLYPVYNILYI